MCRWQEKEKKKINEEKIVGEIEGIGCEYRVSKSKRSNVACELEFFFLFLFFLMHFISELTSTFSSPLPSYGPMRLIWPKRASSKLH